MRSAAAGPRADTLGGHWQVGIRKESERSMQAFGRPDGEGRRRRDYDIQLIVSQTASSLDGALGAEQCIVQMFFVSTLHDSEYHRVRPRTHWHLTCA